MTSQQKVIIGVGVAGAYLLLTKNTKAGTKAKNPLTSALSKLLPTRGTNSPAVASTNMATRGGTTSTARVPSSGLGFGSAAQRGLVQAPTTVGAVAQGAGSALQGLFNFLARRPASPASTQSPRSSGSSGGGMSGGSGAGAGGAGARGSSPMGGSAGVAGQYYSNGYIDANGQWHGYEGYYDENGNFIATDADGNPVSLVAGTDNGHFDENGNFIDDSYDPGGSNFVGPMLPGAIDENGNVDPTSDPAVEFVGPFDEPDSFLPGGNDFVGPMEPPLNSENFNIGDLDPIMVDDPSVTGIDDGSISAVDGNDFLDFEGGGAGGDNFGDFEEEF